MTGITGRIIETMSQAECEIAEDIDRAEAAEAEAEDAILAASDAAQREENAMHALSHFRARVAELEARAEAAEADRDDAVAVELSDVLILLGLDPNDFELDQMRGVTHGVIDAMRQRNDALAARVADLEAQLAAQGWRPVTDYPANGQEVDLIVPATYYQAEYDPFTAEMMLAGYYLSDDGDMLRTLPTHWRPRPSPSIAAEATE